MNFNYYNSNKYNDDNFIVKFLKSVSDKSDNEHVIEKTIRYDVVLKTIKLMKSNINNNILIVYGDNLQFENYFKTNNICYIRESLKNYVIYYFEDSNIYIESLILKTNKVILIDSSPSLKYLDYHNIETLNVHNNNHLNNVFDFLIIKNIEDINYREYLLSYLLYKLDIKYIEKFILNHNSKIISYLINSIKNNYRNVYWTESFLVKLINTNLSTNLLNYDFNVIKHIYSLDYREIKKRYKGTRYNNTFNFVIESISFEQIKRVNDFDIFDQTKIIESLNLVTNNNNLYIFNNNEHNNKLINDFKPYYKRFKKDENYIVFEIKNSISLDDLNKYILDYEIYTIINFNEAKTMVGDLKISDSLGSNLSKMYYLSKYYKTDLKDLLIANFIKEFNEEEQQLLIKNINSKFIYQMFYILKHGKLRINIMPEIKNKLKTNNFNFNELFILRTNYEK